MCRRFVSPICAVVGVGDAVNVGSVAVSGFCAAAIIIRNNLRDDFGVGSFGSRHLRRRFVSPICAVVSIGDAVDLRSITCGRSIIFGDDLRNCIAVSIDSDDCSFGRLAVNFHSTFFCADCGSIGKIGEELQIEQTKIFR